MHLQSSSMKFWVICTWEFVLITFRSFWEAKNVLFESLFEFMCVISVLHISVFQPLLEKQNTSSYSCVVLNIKRAHSKTQRLSHRCLSFFIINVHIDSRFISIQFVQNFSIKSIKLQLFPCGQNKPRKYKHQNVSRQQRVSNCEEE